MRGENKPLKRSRKKKNIKTNKVSQNKFKDKLDTVLSQPSEINEHDVLEENSLGDFLKGGGKFFSN